MRHCFNFYIAGHIIILKSTCFNQMQNTKTNIILLNMYKFIHINIVKCQLEPQCESFWCWVCIFYDFYTWNNNNNQNQGKTKTHKTKEHSQQQVRINKKTTQTPTKTWSEIRCPRKQFPSENLINCLLC